MATVEKYGFDVKSGGYTEYSGIIDTAKEIASVRKYNDVGKVEWYFADGHKFTVTATITEYDDFKEATDITKEWE